MIRLEQIRELNDKVQSTLEVIRVLREENDLLRSKLEDNEARVKELEVLVSSFRNDQDEIEEGIKGILLQLDRLEDEFTAPPAPRSEEAEVVENAPSVEEEDSTADDSAEEDGESARAESNPSEALLGLTPADEAVSSPVAAASGDHAAAPSPAGDGLEGFTPGEDSPGSHPSLIEASASAEDIDEGTPPETPAEAPAPDSGETELDIF